MNCDVGEVTESLENELFQAFHHFTYITAHSPTLLLLYLHHSSFSNPSFASLTSQLIIQSFRCFTYIIAHSPILPSLYLRHSSFSNPSFALPTSQLILQSFRCFTQITAHSPILPSLYLRHSSFSNPFAVPTSQLILKPFFRFYVTGCSLTSPEERPCYIYLFIYTDVGGWLYVNKNNEINI